VKKTHQLPTLDGGWGREGTKLEIDFEPNRIPPQGGAAVILLQPYRM